MEKPYPLYCKDCKWSKEISNARSKSLSCQQPTLNAADSDSLSSITPGISCKDEREKIFLGLCGMRGKLWETK